MPYQWTQERRDSARVTALRTQFWKHSKGPITAKGKRACAGNSKKPASLEMFWDAPEEKSTRLILRRLVRPSRAKPSK